MARYHAGRYGRKRHEELRKPTFDTRGETKKKRRPRVGAFAGFKSPAAEALACAAAAVILTLVVYAATRLIGTGFRVEVDDVSELKVSYASVESLHALAERFGLDFSELLTVYLLENRFFPVRGGAQDENTLERILILDYGSIKAKYSGNRLEPYLDIIRRVLAEIRCFPVTISGIEAYDEDERSRADICGYMYGDGFRLSADRHVGTDIYDRENTPGRLTVVSVCDGVVADKGHNRTDGNYVVVLTDSGNRYHYCHLGETDGAVSEGARVAAGQILGTMGASGTGCRAGGVYARLHLGIEIKTGLSGDMWLNPYIFLRLIEQET